MGKWDKLKTFIGIPDDSDVVGEDTAVETSEAEVKQPLTTAKKEAVRSASSAASSGVQGGKGQVNMVIIKSTDYGDARTVADHILSNRAVLLNLESCNKEMAQRILDFLSGVVYAQGGDLQRVAHSTYAVTPRNVGLQGELSDESRDEEY